MAGESSEQGAKTQPIPLRDRILSDPDFDLLLKNVREYHQKKERRERILADPDFDLLLKNVRQFHSTQKPTEEPTAPPPPPPVEEAVSPVLPEPATVEPPKLPKVTLKYHRFPKIKRANLARAAAAAAAMVAAGGVANKPVETTEPPPGAPRLVLPSLPTSQISLPELPPFSWPTLPEIPKLQAAPEPTRTPTSVPPTATQRPTETPTPTATRAPEVKVFKKDLFREYLAPRLYEKIRQVREARAQNDPEYLARINPELNEDRINILWLGGRKEEALTDSIQILSYHIPTNTVHIISVPRDLQSPRVLRKTGDPRNSRFNQGWGEGGKEFSEKVEFVKKDAEDLSGLSMDLLVYGNFEFFIELIDRTVKTVEVTIDRKISDPTYPAMEGSGFDPFYLDSGTQELDAQTALKVARSRHGSSDYDRSARQQQIILSLFKRIFQGSGGLDQLSHLKNAREVWYKKIQEGTLKPDFDLNELFLSDVMNLVTRVPFALWQWKVEGIRLAEMPEIFTTGITNKNFVAGAGVPGVSISKIAGGNPYSPNPRRDYYGVTRRFTEQFLTKNLGQPPEEEEIRLEVPAIEKRILHPQELAQNEVKAWIGRLRDSHDQVITESLFTYELTSMPVELREKVMGAIARAHAKALIAHYGDVEAIIGLDPGHGGDDIGSAGKTPEGHTLAEKDLTWHLSQLIAKEIYEQSAGKYIVVFLRPENPHDEDLDQDGKISPIERLQKRKALLLAMEQRLKKYEQRVGDNIVYLSLHLNGSPDPNRPGKGAETYWPNETAVKSDKYRASSKKLAERLQKELVEAIQEAGYEVEDRSAKEDPDKREPLANAETTVGPYVALGSPKLDRVLSGG